jgi:hypothetical protein
MLALCAQFRGMEAGGLLPDAHTLAAVVGAHLKAGQRDQAAQLLADAATAYPAHIPKYTFAFNALLEACAQQVRGNGLDAGEGGLRGDDSRRTGPSGQSFSLIKLFIFWEYA